MSVAIHLHAGARVECERRVSKPDEIHPEPAPYIVASINQHDTALRMFLDEETAIELYRALESAIDRSALLNATTAGRDCDTGWTPTTGGG